MAETVQEQNDRPPENMQLTIDALNANPDIVVVGGFERTFIDSRSFPPQTRGISHTLNIFTHPVTPTYESQLLNELAAQLIGDIPTTYVSQAKQEDYGSDIRLSPPVWHVDDVIGSITLEGSIQPNSDSIAVKTGQILPASLAYSFRLLQRTVVTIFPDIHHVAEAARGEVEYSEPVLNMPLEESKEGDFIRLLSHAPALGGSRSFELDDRFAARDAIKSIPDFILKDIC